MVKNRRIHQQLHLDSVLIGVDVLTRENLNQWRNEKENITNNNVSEREVFGRWVDKSNIFLQQSCRKGPLSRRHAILNSLDKCLE